jgi:ribonuclease Y
MLAMTPFLLSALASCIVAFLLVAVVIQIQRGKFAREVNDTIGANRERMETKAKNLLERSKNEYDRRQELIAEQLKHDETFYQSTTLAFEERKKTLQVADEHIAEKYQMVEEKHQQLEKLRDQVASKEAERLQLLEKTAGIISESCLATLMQQYMESECENQQKRLEKRLYHFSQSAQHHAKAVMNVINQRYCGESTRDPTLIEIEFTDKEFERIVGDEQMSKIIHLEQSLGSELKFELQEKKVRIFGYDLWRRYIIKGALERMKKQPQFTLEKALADTQAYTETRMLKIGNKACQYLGITDFPEELVKLVGRLDYRTSFGQNIYRHSIEVAMLGKMIAEEIGCDPYICIVGGLLHDIGKGVDADVAGAHDVIGRDIALNFHLHPDIVHSIFAHHEVEPYRSIEARVVQLADAISAARPGARHHESLEDYISRMKALEEAALQTKGVDKAFVIQAGREVRAFVDPEKVNDVSAQTIAKEIAIAVQASNAVRSGEVKIQVIREYQTHAYTHHRGNHKPKR